MKGKVRKCFSEVFLEYETPRQVLVKNWKVALVCRLIQLGVLGYIIGWMFIYEKGYQTEEIAIGSVFTKMKGVTHTYISGEDKIWDAADYVFPQHGDSSFVVMTNYISTKGQKRGRCPELPDEKNNCTKDADCAVGQNSRTGNGPMTGKCVTTTSTCEISSWCPVENDNEIPNPPILQAAENFTLFIKNSITFRQFNVVRSNLVEGVDKNYLKSCLYDPVTDPLCPIFRLGDIVERSGFSFSDIAYGGGAIDIVIDWDCNLDLSIEQCKPKYEFCGLYETRKNDKASSTLGYNFRFAKYFTENGVEKRSLTKVFGVRIDIIIDGRAGKFDIIPTFLAIGSGVGMFGIATVVCDVLLLNLLQKSDFYNTMKFKRSEDDESSPCPSLTGKDQSYQTNKD